MTDKLVFFVLSIALTLIAFVPYIASTARNETKPHVFSWVIWGLTTGVVFFAQIEDEGGLGAWPTGLSGALTLLVALLAFVKHSDTSIKPLDWVFFVSALASIPFWYLTSDPMWAVVILTSVDVLGFGPTIRKAYNTPNEESCQFFTLFIARSILSVFALENYSVTTLLFPLAVSAGCAVLIVILLIRRRTLGKTSAL